MFVWEINKAKEEVHSVTMDCYVVYNKDLPTHSVPSLSIGSDPLHNKMGDTHKSSENAQDVPNLDIPSKDFFDFMNLAYQVYECAESFEETAPNALNFEWDDLEKNPVIKMLLEVKGSDAIAGRRGSEGGALLDSSHCALDKSSGIDIESKDHTPKKKGELRRNSLNVYAKKSNNSKTDGKHDSEEMLIESILKTKLSEVLNEGILDSVLPYMVGHFKTPKINPTHQPIIGKKPVSFAAGSDTKKNNEKEPKEKSSAPSREKLGRRRSTITSERSLTKPDGEVEIHVCDEVKGLKRDFKCPQKLLVSKMSYFADVTSGQKLEDMDISVHCDIQIFDWLMRWVKKDTILVADWPILDPNNVIPILVSASFLQMEPLLDDCLMYCHGHMTEIVKTNTNLSCLNDSILTRLGAMYTNAELEAIKDRKDKIQSRLFCKMIMSLGEPVPETLRGHYASLSTLLKCTKCYKLLPRQLADKLPCLPSSMSFDNRGNIMSSHTRDSNWNLSEYITLLFGELKTWKKVYWRLWGECHFLKCTVCDNWFPVHQMEWCCYHADVPQFFTLEPAKPTCLPIGRYPCCSERAYRFQVLSKNTGCQYKEHVPDQTSDKDIAIFSIYNEYKEIISLNPTQVTFPERLTRFVVKEAKQEVGKLESKEIFWWDGLKLAPPRQPLGLLGKLYSGNPNTKAQGTSTTTTTNKVNSSEAINLTNQQSNSPQLVINADEDLKQEVKTVKSSTISELKDQIIVSDGKEESSQSSSSEEAGAASDSSSSNTSSSSSHSEESSPLRSPLKRRNNASRTKFITRRRRIGGGGRQWAATLSARSNQDQQRQFEERAGRQMRALLARRVVHQHVKQTQPLGGVYIKLEAEWREATIPSSTPAVRSSRHLYSAKLAKSRHFK